MSAARAAFLLAALVVVPARADDPRPTLVPSTVPVPDPTLITTQQIDKATAAITVTFNDKLAAIKELVTQSLTYSRAESAAQIKATSDLLDAKIDSLKATEAADRVAQAEALVKALQAQQQSVSDHNTADALAANKSETNFADKIKGLEGLVGLQKTTLDDKLSGVNDRLTRLEGLITAANASRDDLRSNRDESRLDTGTVLGALGLIVAVIVGLVAVMGFVRRQS